MNRDKFCDAGAHLSAPGSLSASPQCRPQWGPGRSLVILGRLTPSTAAWAQSCPLPRWGSEDSGDASGCSQTFPWDNDPVWLSRGPEHSGALTFFGRDWQLASLSREGFLEEEELSLMLECLMQGAHGEQSVLGVGEGKPA